MAITYEFNGKIGPYDMISLYEHDYNDNQKQCNKYVAARYSFKILLRFLLCSYLIYLSELINQFHH